MVVLAAAVGIIVATGAGIVAGVSGIVYLYKKSEWSKQVEEKLERIMAMIDANMNCHVKDSAALRGKIRNIIEGRSNCFQILSDFDRTLTSCFVEDDKGAWVRGLSSFQVVERYSQLDRDAGEALQILHDKYYPIEMSPTMSIEEKTPKMIQWFKSSIELSVRAGIKEALIPAMVREARVTLRPGMDQFLHRVKEHNIPVLIASAGLGDVINEIFLQQANLPYQVSVLANFYLFGKNGEATGLKNKEMLHTFNKNKIYSIHKEYFDKRKDRKNAFIMGDTLGDPAMATGIDYLECTVKIGFLNENIDESLSEYTSAYDIVFSDDQSMAVINVLLHELFSDCDQSSPIFPCPKKCP